MKKLFLSLAVLSVASVFAHLPEDAAKLSRYQAELQRKERELERVQQEIAELREKHARESSAASVREAETQRKTIAGERRKARGG
jgi:Skp family chaperone for outer membrane proteins